ncbi:unnamed protein product [Ranitomeya imitator]|uniref:Uncharacterized protein n=1 Tax=Ranitomeya imitator TaxID=111125 RepID=A0ABN9LTM0_9NEOB|nr:unnamed protein product [Ranitomeya imitator]
MASVLPDRPSCSRPVAIEVKDGHDAEKKNFFGSCSPPPIRLDSQSRGVKQGLEAARDHRGGPRQWFPKARDSNSFNVGFKHPTPFKRRRRVNSDCGTTVLTLQLPPGRVHLRPLNLNSLLDEEVNRVAERRDAKVLSLPGRKRAPEPPITAPPTGPTRQRRACAGRTCDRYELNTTIKLPGRSGAAVACPGERGCRGVPLPAASALRQHPAPARERRTSSKSEGRHGQP